MSAPPTRNGSLMDWSGKVESLLGNCVDTFGTDAIYKPVTASQYALRGVFDKAYKSVDPQTDNAGVVSTYPAFGVRLSDMEATPAKGDQVIVGGVTYRVIRSEPDGQGGSTLVLHRI